MKIDKEYRFDNFKVNQGNKLAFSLALKVAEEPGKSYSPLFISGNNERTHLMNAIVNYILEHFDYKVVYIKASDISNITNNIDVLIIDELDSLSTLEETKLLEVIKLLQSNNKQIVLGSSKPLEELNNISDKLKDVINWGMSVNIKDDSGKKIADYNWL